jgi:hypothetical protein
VLLELLGLCIFAGAFLLAAWGLIGLAVYELVP